MACIVTEVLIVIEERAPRDGRGWSAGYPLLLLLWWRWDSSQLLRLLDRSLMVIFLVEDISKLKVTLEVVVGDK